MKLILHIGMGKTGTSSIQTALRTGTEELKAQKVHYLGMWFDAIDPAYRGHAGLVEFMALDDAAKQNAAQLFLAHLQRQAEITGADTFIISNEGIFGNVHRITPFLRALQHHLDLSVIAYIRNPYKWLPSAFTQWGLFHKQQTGPLQTFRERAKVLIEQYAAMPDWIENYGDQLIVRKHDTSVDVVQNFSEACGISIQPPKVRELERSEPVEIMLRAAFNGRHEQEVLPARFERVVARSNHKVVELQKIKELCFSYDGIGEIIENRRILFEKISTDLGPEFDFLSEPSITEYKMDDADFHRRLVDHLVEITFQQGERIKRLENQVETLSKT